MLLLLVIKAKVQPFIALLLVSLVVALAAGIPAGDVSKVMIAGMGGVLGSVTIIIGLGTLADGRYKADAAGAMRADGGHIADGNTMAAQIYCAEAGAYYDLHEQGEMDAAGEFSLRCPD